MNCKPPLLVDTPTYLHKTWDEYSGVQTFSLFTFDWLLEWGFLVDNFPYFNFHFVQKQKKTTTTTTKNLTNCVKKPIAFVFTCLRIRVKFHNFR